MASSVNEPCQHCNWFKNIPLDFSIEIGCIKLLVHHVEARTVPEPDGLPRHCHLLQPKPKCLPLITRSKLQQRGETCIILWFGGEYFEGLDFEYYMDKAGTLWDGDDEKIVSYKIPALQKIARGIVFEI